jgi:translation initiation factor 2 alpha subunit (eIF-2alpha)
LKLLKTNAAIWFNKICKTKGLQLKYISIHSNGKSSRDLRTIQQATRYRINQEIKYLYKGKQHLNQQLYQTHLEGASLFNGMWQHALSNIEEGHSTIMEQKYKNLYSKMTILEGRAQSKHGICELHNTNKDRQPRIIKLTNKQLTVEQLKIEFRPSICYRNKPYEMHQ